MMRTVSPRYRHKIQGPILKLLGEEDFAIDSLAAIQGKIHEVQLKCSHVFVPTYKEYDPTDRWFSCSTICQHCAKDGGWYCPKSPDGECHYAADDHVQDHCLHCGLPDERK
jgi:hypothetical protein